MFMLHLKSLFLATATGKKSVAAMPEEKAESPTQQAPKDPDEKIIIESHENGIRALATIVSASLFYCETQVCILKIFSWCICCAADGCYDEEALQTG